MRVPPAHADQLTRQLNNGARVVLGSRVMRGYAGRPDNKPYEYRGYESHFAPLRTEIVLLIGDSTEF
jgi:hypothetical protein